MMELEDNNKLTIEEKLIYILDTLSKSEDDANKKRELDEVKMKVLKKIKEEKIEE